MKLEKEGIFNASIVSCEWIYTPTGKPVCKLGFTTDQGDILGSFYFDEDAPKFGTETGLEKSSRAFANSIPGWSFENMDLPETYIGSEVTIKTKFNLKNFLNVSDIYPLGGGQAKQMTNLEKIKAAAKLATQGITPIAKSAPVENNNPW